MIFCKYYQSPPVEPTSPGDNIECKCMLSMHCDISLIHASLSCTVDATRCIQCRAPDLQSTNILKSRLLDKPSLTLYVLPPPPVRVDNVSASNIINKIRN